MDRMDVALLKMFFDMLWIRVTDRGIRAEGDGGECTDISRAVEKSASGTRCSVCHDDGNNDGNEDKSSRKISNIHHLAQYFNFML